MSRGCSGVTSEYYMMDQGKVTADPNVFYLRKLSAIEMLVYHASYLVCKCEN